MTSPARHASGDGGWLDSLPLALHLIGLYLAIPVVLPGGAEFPVATTLVTVPLLLALNATRVRVAPCAWLAALLFVAGCTLAFAPRPAAFFGERLNGLLLWGYSLLCAYALMLELTRWSRDRLARLLLAFVLLLMAGCLLEIFGGLRPLSDAFRSIAFPTGGLSFRQRDLEIAGFERPRLFTSEPSDVAKFLLLASFGWVALSRARMRHVVGIGLCLAAVALTRSPISLLLLPLQALLMALGRPMIRPSRLFSRPIVATMLLVAASLAVAVAGALLAGRVAQAIEGRDASSTIRIVAPVVIAWETLAASPWWGAGISGTESIEESIVVGFELAGIASLADPTALNSDMSLANLVGNAFWLHWINLGLLGGAVAIVLLVAWMRSMGVRRTGLALAAMFLFAQTMGAAHAPYFWSYLAVCAALAWHLDSSDLLEWRAASAMEYPVRLQESARGRI